MTRYYDPISARLTVGELKRLLDSMAVPDDAVIVVGCCQSSTAGHVLTHGTFASQFSENRTFSLDPDVTSLRAQDGGAPALWFSADDDYVSEHSDDFVDDDELD